MARLDPTATERTVPIARNDDMAYLTVLGWPARFTHDDRVEALVASAAMDPETATLEARAEPPTIPCLIDAILRDDILSVLHGAGVLAIAPSETEFRASPEPEPVKRVLRFPGTDPASFVTDDNDEPAWTFTSDDIRLIVHGRTRSTSTEVRPSGSSAQMISRYGAAAQNPEDHVRRETTTDSEEYLDLHLVLEGSPRLLRLRGMRTLIRPLEEATEKPSLLSPPDPIELIEPHAPGVPIDRDFGSFNPPGFIATSAIVKGPDARRLSPEAFAFYSAWRALTDRALRGE